MRLISFAALGLVALCLLGCTKGFSGRGSGAVEGVFRYPIVTAPTSLDPGIVQDGDTLDLIQQIYEGLLTWSPDNEPVGALAESWEISDDGLRYVFHLRRGVLFHSGRECKAQDVKWSFERNADPSLASPTFEAYLSDIVGVSDRSNGRADEIEGVQVIDDYTIEIRLTQPTPYFLGKLIYLVSAVMDKDFAPRGEEMSKVSQMVGTGLFKIVRHERKQMVVLEAFQDYHGGAPKLKNIERMVILDPMTRLNKYKNGELDMVMLARQDLDGLNGTEFESHLKTFPRPAIWYVGLNQERFEPFKDKRVRQAFAMAIDKERIVNEILGGHNVIANCIVPPGVPGHRPDAPALPFDPARAKQLLAQAGYPDGVGFPEMVMTFREGRPDILLAATTVAENLSTHLNIDVTLQTMEWRAYLEKYNSHDQVFFHMRWAADYLDPQNFLSHMLATYGPENKIGYNNPEFDRLCKLADTMMEMEDRIPLYQEAEDILLDDAVWIPLYFQRDAELHRPGLSGLRESLFGHLPHTTVVMKR